MSKVRIVPLVAAAVVVLSAAAGADAARIIFSSNRADGARELYTVDRDGSGEHRITFNDVLERQPVFSPDGARIAFAGLRDGIWDIYTIDAEGGDLQQLTEDAVRDDYPRWTADGRITYQRGSEPCPCSAWIMDADGGNAEQIPIAGNVLTPEPSPHGQRLAYASDADGRYALYVSNLKGRGARRITEPASGFGDFMPRWSPSGNELAFLRNLDVAGRPADLYVVHSDGTGLRQLTRSDRFEYFVAWNGNDELDFAAAPPFRLWALDLTTGDEKQLRTWPSAPLHERFDDGIRDASLWHEVVQGGGASIREAGGRLEVDFATGSTGSIGAHVGLGCQVVGDFDAQVEYELLEWPAVNGMQAYLAGFTTHTSAQIFRESKPWGENYGSWIDPVSTGTPTSDPTGFLRLTRTGGVVTTWYLDGGTWVAHAVGSRPEPLTLAVGAGDFNTLSGLHVRVTFDDFRLNSGELSCPSWWSDIWVDVG